MSNIIYGSYRSISHNLQLMVNLHISFFFFFFFIFCQFFAIVNNFCSLLFSSLDDENSFLPELTPTGEAKMKMMSASREKVPSHNSEYSVNLETSP